MSRRPEQDIANEIRLMREENKRLITCVDRVGIELKGIYTEMKVFVTFLIKNAPDKKE